MSQPTWTCHICKRIRPDDKISVYKKPFVLAGKITAMQHIRYCNDNPDCWAKAKEHTFLK